MSLRVTLRVNPIQVLYHPRFNLSPSFPRMYDPPFPLCFSSHNHLYNDPISASPLLFIPISTYTLLLNQFL